MTTNKYKAFDPADYLEGMDDVAGYLEVALAESAEDPSALPRALGVIARSQNMSELARRVGMSRDGKSRAECAGRPTAYENWRERPLPKSPGRFRRFRTNR